MTPATLRLTLARAGLSNAEAARLLGVTDRTVSRWLAGDVEPTPSHVAKLAGLIKRQDTAVSLALATYCRRLAEHGSANGEDLWLPKSDADSVARGWPCKGAHVAVLRRCAEGLKEIGVEVREHFIGDAGLAPPAPLVR